MSVRVGISPFSSLEAHCTHCIHNFHSSLLFNSQISPKFKSKLIFFHHRSWIQSGLSLMLPKVCPFVSSMWAAICAISWVNTTKLPPSALPAQDETRNHSRDLIPRWQQCQGLVSFSLGLGMLAPTSPASPRKAVRFGPGVGWGREAD